MTKSILRNFFVLAGMLMLVPFAVLAQKGKPAATPKPVIFAVLHDGSSLEPIAYINKGKLDPAANGSDEPIIISSFNRNHYKKAPAYSLIFGGGKAGTVTVKSANSNAECGKNIAEATTKATKTPLKGLVMGLATNAAVKSTTSFRRKPTAAEKDEADALAKAEFAKEKLTPKVLRFQNLTALDLDNDGTAELVGSYWVEIDKLTRGLLFFIASKMCKWKHTVRYKEYQSVNQSKVMSGAIKDVDDGVYHELLLDVFDYDGDGTSEVFTYVQSFEGAGFNAYRRNGGKWTRAFEVANYHCGY